MPHTLRLSIHPHRAFVPDTLALQLVGDAVPHTPPLGFLGPRPTTDRKGKLWVFHPELHDGRSTYRPRVAITERPLEGGTARYATVGFSAPKYIRGNNVEESVEADLPAVVQRLERDLACMGLSATAAALLRAPIVSYHAARNVALPSGTTCTSVIDAIASAVFTTKTDVEKVVYDDGGRNVTIHTNAWELAVYDKRVEAERGTSNPKRVLSRESRNQRLPEGLVLPGQLLRVELRLNTRRAIRARLAAIGYEERDLTLAAALSEDLENRMLLAELDRLERRLLLGLEPADLGRVFLAEMAESGRRGYATLVEAIAMSALLPLIGAKGVRRALADAGYRRNYFDDARKRMVRYRERAGQRTSPLDVIRKGIIEQPRMRSRGQ